VELTEQFTKHGDDDEYSDHRNTQHNRKIEYYREYLKHSNLRLPFSASGRNWDGTETIWPNNTSQTETF
jgi:hypothetical protein